MKNLNVIAVAALTALTITSCKNEAKDNAQKNVDHYVAFVDSVNNLDAAERSANWEAIASEYDVKKTAADSAVVVLGDEAKTEKVNESNAKYDGVKAAAEADAKAKAEAAAATAAPAGGGLADTLFGPGVVVGDDMKFAWVNKDNILSVYQKFYETFDANKDAYSRQDLDKIKAWYEALDARKNTVEKEGLSSSDNTKIAGLKLKFAPKFKWERLTAKGEENDKAKKEAN
jgi:hypothetical protein